MKEQARVDFPDQKIVDIEMHDEVKKSFIAYSMSVITSRALPDVRDGLKPVQRRILYSMYEEKYTYDRHPLPKSAKVVGAVMGNYHPHGDSSVYMALVRMAQTFSYRYPLVYGSGCFGSVDGDPPAAMRYTEAKLERLSEEMVSDINKDVVDFRPNYDNTLKEPVVLPSRFPNLLVNGSMGIAVGMATNIPTHNLAETIDGTLYLMDHPEATTGELMQYIKGPDFPTGALIYGTAGIYEAYATGRGHITVRSRCNIDEDHHQIVVTEIPYGVNKSELVKAIWALKEDKRVDGMTGLRDESGRHGMKIVIDYRRDVNPQVLLNQLFRYTQLQDTCAVNMVALVGGEPKTCTLKDILVEYVKHQEDVVTRRLRFDLNRARREAHIYEGYKIALDHIDEIVKIIRASASVADAKSNLCERFGLDDVQAQAIVDMTLGRLTGLERQKIEDRLAKLYEEINYIEGVLASEEKLKELIKTEMTVIRDRYADNRLTEIVPVEDEIMLEDLIERHNCLITVTHDGYVKRQRADVYSAQRRGGKGIIAMSTKEEDFIERVISADSHSDLLMFTDTGKVFTRRAYQIPESGRTSRGTNIANILELESGESVTAFVTVNNADNGGYKNGYLTMVTRNGTIKRTELSEFEYQRKGGKRAITLEDGDELLFVGCTDGERDIIIASSSGRAVRFSEKAVRCQGRTARGVRGIRLREGERVVGATVVDEDKTLLTITENGFGKRTEFDLFEVKNRGGLGIYCHNITPRTGALVGIASVGEDEDIMLITDAGIMIRTRASDISTYRRAASGVIVMRTGESKVANFAIVERDEDAEVSKVETTEQEDVVEEDVVEDVEDVEDVEGAEDVEDVESEDE